ncbi:MAG: glycosyltransferase [Sandaracinaceae bacterium]
MPTATVVIPTYRRPARLRALLDCLTRQSPDALARVVVCDDGSGDETEAVARSFVDRLPLEYAWQPDLGFRAGQARNMGIERAIGDIVVFVDDDVILRPDFVAEHLAAHAGHDGSTIAIGYRHRTDHFEGGIPSAAEILAAEREDRLLELEGPIEEHPTPWIYVYSCNFSVTRGAAELRFDEGFFGWGLEDTELGYRVFHAGARIVEARGARVLHVEDPTPRDPFRCEVRALPPSYDTYVENAVYFMDKHPHDRELEAFVRGDLRWYVLDEHGRWVKNGYANDVDAVISGCRARLRARAASRTSTTRTLPETA